MYRVLRMNRHCYVFCDFEMLQWLVHCATGAGFYVHKPLVWDKQHFSVRKVFLRGPTEKPFGLMDILVRQSTNPGELVVDPFMGSGVVGEAAMNRECVFWGNDLDGPTVERAQVRLQQYFDGKG
jgi:site-specific DNA-methyltransferase (adenine-specific)